jgi:hypothetical protein
MRNTTSQLPQNYLKLATIALKLTKPASIFSMISVAKTSGSGRLSKSAQDLSISIPQKYTVRHKVSQIY